MTLAIRHPPWPLLAQCNGSIPLTGGFIAPQRLAFIYPAKNDENLLRQARQLLPYTAAPVSVAGLVGNTQRTTL